MMLNRATFVGHILEDAVVTMTSTGSPRAAFALNVPRPNAPAGSARYDAFDIVAFGDKAHLCGQLAKEGVLAFVEGRMQWRETESDRKLELLLEKIFVDTKEYRPSKAPLASHQSVNEIDKRLGKIFG